MKISTLISLGSKSVAMEMLVMVVATTYTIAVFTNKIMNSRIVQLHRCQFICPSATIFLRIGLKKTWEKPGDKASYGAYHVPDANYFLPHVHNFPESGAVPRGD